MSRSEIASQLTAALIALVAWTGVAVQGVVSYHLTGSLASMLWTVTGYFTITTNLLVALVFTVVAVRGVSRVPAWIMAGTLLSILLVGAIYGLLLHGLLELSGGSAAANVLLHMVTPILVPLFWLLSVRKGTLTWRHPLLWSIYPLAYLPYALVRGAVSGRYAYPFLDVARLGWERTALNILAISAAFLLCGYAVVWLDRRLSAA